MQLSKTEGSSGFILHNHQPAAPVKSLKIDVHHYQELLDMPDLSEELRSEILTTLWSMIMTLIDLGYKVHPHEMADLPAIQNK